MLRYLWVCRKVRFTGSARLTPWPGPALADELGRVLGSSPHASGPIFHANDEQTSPFAFEFPFPMPLSVRAGDEVTVALGLVGPAAIDKAPHAWQAVAEAGRQAGSRPAVAPFVLGDEVQAEGSEAITLSDAGAPTTALPRLRVTLSGPLFLRVRNSRGWRRPVVEPSFADLLRASVAALAGLFGRYGSPLPADPTAIKQAAASVPLLASNYVPFHPDGNGPRGVVGNGVYGPVPQALVTWLAWGGKVHVGAHRTAGAGGWRVGPA
jgi:hypothetical protein